MRILFHFPSTTVVVLSTNFPSRSVLCMVGGGSVLFGKCMRRMHTGRCCEVVRTHSCVTCEELLSRVQLRIRFVCHSNSPKPLSSSCLSAYLSHRPRTSHPHPLHSAAPCCPGAHALGRDRNQQSTNTRGDPFRGRWRTAHLVGLPHPPNTRPLRLLQYSRSRHPRPRGNRSRLHGHCRGFPLARHPWIHPLFEGRRRTSSPCGHQAARITWPVSKRIREGSTCPAHVLAKQLYADR